MNTLLGIVMGIGGTLLVGFGGFAMTYLASIRSDVRELKADTNKNLDKIDRRIDGIEYRMRTMDETLAAVKYSLRLVEHQLSQLGNRPTQPFLARSMGVQVHHTKKDPEADNMLLSSP